MNMDFQNDKVFLKFTGVTKDGLFSVTHTRVISRPNSQAICPRQPGGGKWRVEGRGGGGSTGVGRGGKRGSLEARKEEEKDNRWRQQKDDGGGERGSGEKGEYPFYC
jgi:hypothetical protein